MNLVLTGSTSGIGWETLKELLPEFKKKSFYRSEIGIRQRK